MYTDFNHLFIVTTRNVWRIKVKLRLPPHLYSVTPYLAKHTLLLISMLHFLMCNILKFTQNSLVVLIPYLLIYWQQCNSLWRHYYVILRLCVLFSVLMVLINRGVVPLRHLRHVPPQTVLRLWLIVYLYLKNCRFKYACKDDNSIGRRKQQKL